MIDVGLIYICMAELALGRLKMKIEVNGTGCDGLLFSFLYNNQPYLNPEITRGVFFCDLCAYSPIDEFLKQVLVYQGEDKIFDWGQSIEEDEMEVKIRSRCASSGEQLYGEELYRVFDLEVFANEYYFNVPKEGSWFSSPLVSCMRFEGIPDEIFRQFASTLLAEIKVVDDGEKSLLEKC